MACRSGLIWRCSSAESLTMSLHNFGAYRRHEIDFQRQPCQSQVVVLEAIHFLIVGFSPSWAGVSFPQASSNFRVLTPNSFPVRSRSGLLAMTPPKPGYGGSELRCLTPSVLPASLTPLQHTVSPSPFPCIIRELHTAPSRSPTTKKNYRDTY